MSNKTSFVYEFLILCSPELSSSQATASDFHNDCYSLKRIRLRKKLLHGQISFGAYCVKLLLHTKYQNISPGEQGYKKKRERERVQQYDASVTESTDRLSASQNGLAWGWIRVSGPCWNRTHVTWLFVNCLNQSTSKRYSWILIQFFTFRIFIPGLLKLNIKARRNIPEFLTAKLCQYIL